MVWLISTLCGAFLGPLAVAFVVTSIQIRRLEKEERRLARRQEIEDKYGVTISDEDLTMNVKR